MRIRVAGIISSIGLLASAAHASAMCLDLQKGEPLRLTGVLEHRVFAGPPNFEDVQTGDTPEPGYVLKLAEAICITGDEFSDPKRQFNEVQVVPLEGLERRFLRLKNEEVHISIQDRSGAQTGHHHRPLVVWADGVEPVGEPFEVEEQERTIPAKAVVQAFYAALRAGDGSTAATYLVPEKTRRGPLSASALTQFYSSLDEPIRLLSVQTAADDIFEVRYAFRHQWHSCDGSATVTTVVRDGKNFIKTIRAHNGC